MYQPKRYKKNEPEYIFSFIRSHPFATLIIKGNRLMATHVPVLAEGHKHKFRLFGHIARHNEMLSFLKNGTEVLLVFQGPHGYVSSSWYQKKNISTWDYSAVHVNAQIKLQSETELHESLDKLLKRFETNQQNPMFLNDIPSEMIAENLPMICGFWCEPTKVEAIAKLHQGFGNEDINVIITHLENGNRPNLSALSKNIKEEHGTSN